MLQRNLEYFTLNDFLEWAERQSGAYDYDSPVSCACAKFLNDRTGLIVRVNPFGWHYRGEDDERPLPTGMDAMAKAEPHTFEALSARLRASLSQSSSADEQGV